MSIRTSTSARRGGLGVTAAGALIGSALTAAAFLFLGPNNRRRRAVAADRLRHLEHKAAVGADRARRDLRQRARGMLAHRHGPDELVDDGILVARVRSSLGHVCSHPHAIEVECRAGVAVLRGDILAVERARVVQELRRVPGVSSVVDELTAHASAESVPALQGGSPRMRRPEILQRRWSPAMRLVAGAGGSGLVALALSMRRRPVLALASGIVGGSLLLRASTNRELREWGGPFIAHKSIYIESPADEVFALLSMPETFPRFMTHVRAVRKIDEDHWDWLVDGPFGRADETLELVRWLPPDSIAWRSTGGRLDGEVELTPEDTGTRLELVVRFRPPFGGVGLLVARALGRDPKTFLDDDMLRLKSLIENKKATGNAGQVTLDEIATSAQLGGENPEIH